MCTIANTIVKDRETATDIAQQVFVNFWSRKDEIIIMRNVGAKNGYIRAPFLVEGIIIGIIANSLNMFLY